MSGTVSTIQQYYTNILQRPADTAGLSYWTNQVAGGEPLASVETAIATSAEATTYVDPIVQLYEGILGRAPDAAGLASWVQQYESGALSLSQIAADFVNSSEGQALLGTSLTSAAIETLYANSLGRSADSTEVSYWLNSGLNLSQVALDIAESSEANTHLAGANLGYLLNAGAGISTGPSGTSNVIDINGSAQTYTGTSGNDTFNATTGADLTTGVTLNGNGGTDTLNISNFASANGAYYDGVPLGNLGLGAGTVIAPTLNGISTVDISASPGQGTVFTPYGLDLSLSSGMQTAELADSSNSAFDISNASTVATATVDNSASSHFAIVGGPNGTPVATTSIDASPGATLSAADLSPTSSETATITDSPSAALFLGGLYDPGDEEGDVYGEGGVFSPDGSLQSPDVTLNVAASPDASVYLASYADQTPVTDLTLNLTSSSTATAVMPDVLTIADYQPTSVGVTTLDIASTGDEEVADGNSDDYVPAPDDGYGNAQNIVVTAGTGSLTLDPYFDKLATFNSSAYAGNLEYGVADPNISAAADSSLSSTYAGISAYDNAGLAAASSKLTSITTGSGTSVVDLTEQPTLSGVSYAGGSGDDIVFLGDPSSPTTGATFNGGGGDNVLALANGSLTATSAGNTFSNFSTLEIGPNSIGSTFGASGAPNTYNLANLGVALATVAVTGIGGGGSALNGNVALDNAPNNLSVVETAASGVPLDSTGNSLTVQLGAVTSTNGISSHTANFVLNADGNSADGLDPQGVVTAGELDVAANPDESASFIPGAYTETVNIASNIANPASGTPAGLYTNSTTELSAAQATALNITNQASLNVDTIVAPDLQTLTIGGGSGNVTIGGDLDATSLTSVNASTSTGAVSLMLNTDPGEPTYTGLTYTGAMGVDTVTVGGLGGDTFTGNGGNDSFDVSAHDGAAKEAYDTFIYNSATDANVTDPSATATGIYLDSPTLSIENITGFDEGNGTGIPGASGHTGDTIDLSSLGLGSANVLYSTAVGSGPINPAVGGTNLASVPNLFAYQAGGGEGTLFPPGVTPPPDLTTGTYSAFVYQESATEVDVFVGNGSSSAFSASSDLAIQLVNAGGLSAATVAHDLKFA